METRELDRQIQRTKKDEERQQKLASVSKDFDLRDRWCGIRQMKTQYKPVPYAQEDKHGTHIMMRTRAESTAKYLSAQIWG